MATAKRTRKRFLFCALILLILATSSAGLECYCKETVNGMTVSSCENEKCVVSDTSKGRCYVERRTQESSGFDLLKYNCIEIHADEISAEEFLLNTCNITTHDGSTMFQCCMEEDLCNKDIVLPEPTTRSSLDSNSSPSVTTVGDKRDNSDDKDSSGINWTTGTFVTVTVFFFILIVTVVVISTLYVLLRRRKTRRVQVI